MREADDNAKKQMEIAAKEKAEAKAALKQAQHLIVGHAPGHSHGSREYTSKAQRALSFDSGNKSSHMHMADVRESESREDELIAQVAMLQEQLSVSQVKNSDLQASDTHSTCLLYTSPSPRDS